MIANRRGNDNFVIAYGELLWDLLPSGDMLGGAPANFAVRLASLGVPVQLVSRVGADPRGLAAKNEIARHGVDILLLQTDEEQPTGTVDVELTEAGSPSYVINPGVAYDFIQFEDTLIKYAADATFVYYGTLVQRNTPSRETLYALLDMSPHASHFLDVNLRQDCFSSETLCASLERADYLKLSAEEVAPVVEMAGLDCADITRFPLVAVQALDLKGCVVTRGERGAVAADSEMNTFTLSGLAVDVADTIGAGDAFSAGIVAGLIGGKSFEESCQFANAVGAAACTKSGGMAPLSPEEIEAVFQQK